MPVISTTKMTARQFFMLGDDPPGVRLELVDGEVAVSPSPRAPHSYPDRVLSAILVAHILQHDLGILLGDVDTLFGEYDVRRPDIIYYQKSRTKLIRRKSALEHPPDLCVEIVSPSSTEIDRKDKFKQYAAGDVPNYWILDPELRTLEGYQLGRARYRLVGRAIDNESIHLPPFPELEIPLARLWLPDSVK